MHLLAYFLLRLLPQIKAGENLPVAFRNALEHHLGDLFVLAGDGRFLRRIP